MSASFLFLIGTVLFFYFLMVVYMFKNKKEVPLMAGTMAAMALGMLLGLLGGTMAGVYFSGNLFIPTLLGSGIGFLAGALIGLPLNFLTVLEGMLSGLMGGMMGAMLGAMISSEQAETAIKILFLVDILFNVMILYLIVNEQKEGKDSLKKKWLNSPIFMGATLSFIFFVFNMMGPLYFPKGVYEQASYKSHKGHDENQQITGTEQTVEIIANDFTYSPPEIQLKKNRTVTVRLKNIGQVEHDLQVTGLKVDVVKKGHHAIEKGNLHIHVKPGQHDSLTFKPLESGSFSYWCTLPGHKEAGMAGSFTVF